MYHFQISNQRGDYEYENVKGYTFLKFEGYSTYDLGHAKAAISRYIQKIDANPGKLVQLREDCNRKDNNNKCFYFRKEHNNNKNTLQYNAKEPEGTESVVNLDYKPYETWQEEGGLDTMTLASKRVKNLLDNYAKPSLEVEVEEALNAFVNNKKASMPDSFT